MAEKGNSEEEMVQFITEFDVSSYDECYAEFKKLRFEVTHIIILE